LLTAHPQVVMGAERYLRRFESPAFLDPSLFVKDRFFRIESGDTVYSDVDVAPSRYAEMRARYEQAAYRGDKIPMLFQKLPELDRAFGADLRVVMIVRNVWDVAESWQRRVDDPTDDNWATEGVEVAVQTWNEAINAAQEGPGILGDRFLVVSCEALFEQGLGLDELLDWLELPSNDQIRHAHAYSVRKFTERKGRPSSLTYQHRHYITEHADVATWAKVMGRGPWVEGHEDRPRPAPPARLRRSSRHSNP
jgi:hypothetical protein